jgi:HTH-type transcriptional regulator/antitoxin HipB
MFLRSAKEFGILVRSERERRGWSQSELAGKVGVSLPWISQFERGKATAQIDLVLKTLAALEIRLWAGDPPESHEPKAMRIDLDELLKGLSDPTPGSGGGHEPPSHASPRP